MRRHVQVLLLFVLLSLVLTWPLVTHLGSHVPGDGIDDPALAWNLWWAKHALVDQPQNPFSCNWQFWPIGVNLAFYTLTLLNGALSIPLQGTIGLISAYNLLLLSSFFLSAFGAYLLCLDQLGRRLESGGTVRHSSAILWGAVVGGALYGSASTKLFYASLGQANIASSQWAPFAVLYVLKALERRGRWRHAVLATLFIALQAYAELTYASFLALFLVGAAMYIGARWFREHWSARAGWCVALRLASIGVLSLLTMSPFVANMLPDLRAEGDLFSAGGGFADQFSADLVGYVFPTQLHPLLGNRIQEIASSSSPGGGFPVDKGQHVFVGYVAILLVLLGVWRSRRRGGTWFWLSLTVAFFILTLGPSLRVAGRDLMAPLPFTWVAQLPFFSGNRYPSRYAVMLLLSLAPLVAAGAFHLLTRLNRGELAARWRTIGACGLLLLLLFEHLSIPLPLFDLRVPPLYHVVADVPGDFALLELPLGWRNGARVVGKQDIVIMQQLWYQSTHGKRLLGGNTSRNPEYKFQYFSEDPTLAMLLAATDASDLPQHTALREEMAAFVPSSEMRSRAVKWAAMLDVRYVMVHRDSIAPEVEALLRELLPVELLAEDGALALYQVVGRSEMPEVLALGSDADRMALGEGWGPIVVRDDGPSFGYAQRAAVTLLLPLRGEASQLSLRGISLAGDQSMTLVVDGQVIATAPLGGDPTLATFELPPSRRAPPLSQVELRFSRLASVSDLPGGPWPIGQSGARSRSSIVVRSAGEEVGDFGHIYVDGVDLSTNLRGYNLVALDADTGALVARAAFDTHADPFASQRLAEWVGQLKDGTLVAGAARDEASSNLQAQATAALGYLGVSGDLRDRFRWSHAFIGVVASAPGSAVESLNGVRPAQASVGWPLSAPQVAAKLDWVHFAK